MKLSVSDAEIHGRGLGSKHEYKVASNAKIMKMLADSLYSDKVLAPIRELSTNARDGHIRQGTENEAFDIYLPTQAEPDFRIRDYGCGMNREQLTEMYTTYGESDKNDSNDFNGCMGIGSKSPFAYSESFTTTSYHNGKKYVCVNSKDKKGIPTLQFIVDGEDTDERNGIEVSFAVKLEDVYKFTDTASKLYRYFPIKPNVKRGQLNMRPRDYLYEGDNWRIYRDSDDSVAVMGWIAYPIDTKFFSKFDEDSYGYWNRGDDTPEAMLLEMGIEMDFDIGDVEMDIAREALQYNDFTVEAIKERLGEILDFLKAEMEKSFDDCDCLWDARLRYNDLTTGKMRHLEKLTKLQTPQYNGVDLDKSIEWDTVPGCHIVRFAGEGLKKPKRYDRCDSFHVPTTSQLERHSFFENDVERGAYAACERHILDDSNKTEYIYLIRFDDATARQQFIDTMGWKDDSLLNKVSACPKPDPKTRAKRENVFEFQLDRASSGRGSNRWAKDWWKSAEVDFEDGGLYVEINAFKCRRESGGEETSVNVGRMIKLLEELGVEPPEQLVGIKTAVVKKYRKSDDWEDIFTWIKRQFEEYLEENDIGETLANIQEIESFRHEGKYQNIFEDGLTVDLSDSPLTDFYGKIAELRKVQEDNHEEVANAKVLASMLGFNLSGQAKYSLDSEESRILSRYEMLSVLDEWDIRRDDHRDKVARYIQFVDSCEGV